MQCLENSNTETTSQKFNSFLTSLGKIGFKLAHSDPRLKTKIAGYKDADQILSLYDNTFLKTVSSNSKKKSGTILILWTILKFAEIRGMTVESFEDEHWDYIATLFPKFSKEKLKMRWFSSQKSVEQKFPWTEEEDRILTNVIRENLTVDCTPQNLKWTEIAEKYNKVFPKSAIIRLGKHCRERWFNHLDPSIKKGDWTALEDIKLLELILANGRKWSQISKILCSRNENSVKNRFFSLLNKFKKKRNVESDRDSITMILKNLKGINPEMISNPLIKRLSKPAEKALRRSKKLPRTLAVPKVRTPRNPQKRLSNHKLSTQNLEKQKCSKKLKIEENCKVTPERENSDGISSGNHINSTLSKSRSNINLAMSNDKGKPDCSRMNGLSQGIATESTTDNTTMNGGPIPQGMFYPPADLPINNPFLPFPIPNYPNPNLFMNNQFLYPSYFYPMPTMDSINEQIPKVSYPNFIKNFNPGGSDIDLKNISQLVSSLSLSDEYLLEGQKLLSELTFNNSNSLSSFQDRLSHIAPISSKNSASSLLSRKLRTPTSLLLNTSHKPYKVADESSFYIHANSAKKKIQRKKTFHHEERTSEQEEVERGVEQFFKDFNQEKEKHKEDASLIKSLNHLE